MKLKRRNKLQTIWLRVIIAWGIVFRRKHAVIIDISTENLTRLIETGRPKYVDYTFCGMMKHHAGEIIKFAAEKIDDVDIICSKAEFEVEVGLMLKKKDNDKTD